MAEGEQSRIESVAPESGVTRQQDVPVLKVPFRTTLYFFYGIWSQRDVEKEQEAQLRAKYPGMKGPGTSALLQKRLSQKTKYFDSGDYAMAKAKGGSAMKQSAVAGVPTPELTTGEEIPTPENAHPRKAANRLSKLVSMS